MSATVSSKERRMEIDLPANRTYDDRAKVELDESLVEAIRAAEDADHDFLSQLLRYELKSLYYESRLDG